MAARIRSRIHHVPLLDVRMRGYRTCRAVACYTCFQASGYGGWKREGKGAAGAGGAGMEPDIATHCAHDLTADIEAKTCATDLAGARGVESSKASKEAITLLVGDAHALIADINDGKGLALGG